MSPKDKPPKKPAPFNNPFSGVKLEKKDATAPARSAPPPPPPRKPSKPTPEDSDAELFLQAVGEVSPVRSSKKLAPPREPPSAASIKIVNAENEALIQLSELVTGDGPLDLARSEERVEGNAPGLDERILRKLRSGEYEVQGQLDLHGMTQAEARPALERFIHDSRLKGLRCVLVVTGRGLHSADQIPVLREGAQRWLTGGRVARQVLAFTSAKSQHGGTGAIYVLLRR
jgi:DNA-nicking Smr family endonuclease